MNSKPFATVWRHNSSASPIVITKPYKLPRPPNQKWRPASPKENYTQTRTRRSPSPTRCPRCETRGAPSERGTDDSKIGMRVEKLDAEPHTIRSKYLNGTSRYFARPTSRKPHLA